MRIAKATTALPKIMGRHHNLSDWSDPFRSAVSALLQSDDELMLTDFLGSVGLYRTGAKHGHPPSTQDQLRRITAKYTPVDIYCIWQVSEEWAKAVRSLSLADVTKRATSWDSQLTIFVSYWLLEHATTTEVEQLATAVGHPEAAQNVAPNEFDTNGTVEQLATHVSPLELAAAWDTIQPGPLTSGVVASWRHLRRSDDQRNRWHSPTGRELLRRLNDLRAQGTSAHQLAQQLGLSDSTVSRLTATPRHHQHTPSAT